MHRKLWRCAKMHIWALTYFEEVGHITECCYFDAMNFFWSDYCSPKWELEGQHSGHMWVQCLPMGTKWQCMPMGMKVQHSGHMSAMRLKFPFSMFQRLNQHRSHGPIFLKLCLFANLLLQLTFLLIRQTGERFLFVCEDLLSLYILYRKALHRIGHSFVVTKEFHVYQCYCL